MKRWTCTLWILLLVPATHIAAQDGDSKLRDWSLQPVVRPKVPSVERREWLRTPIDAFILERLESKSIAPATDVSRGALLRRLYYDLTGLPPTPDEVEAFESDRTATAYERRVDALLNSPRHGERWGRHWLDLVRFAETNSFEQDDVKPHAWRYRDYVVDSLNQDKPFDQFVLEQLAGDELEPRTAPGLIATGYYRLGAWDFDPTDRLRAQYDDLHGIVSTTAQVFLGMTIECARCHDHKLDPIPQADYYRFVAFFRDLAPHVRVKEPGLIMEHFISRLETEKEDPWKAERESCEHEARILGDRVVASRSRSEQDDARDDPRVWRKIVEDHGEQVLDESQWKFWNQLQRRLAEIAKRAPPPAHALCAVKRDETPATYVLARGNPHAPLEKVEPGFPSILTDDETEKPALAFVGSDATTANAIPRRTRLARWITSDNNPRTARVLANRLWQFHFGRGILRSPSDFGVAGATPTHPDLIDWLASELVRYDWHLKPIHRLLVTSSTYRMTSQPNETALKKDPGNDLFSRFSMRRLAAEELRDSVLSVSGSLNFAMGGPGVFTEIPPEVLAGQSRPGSGWGLSPLAERGRRSIYIHVKRSLIDPMLETFDFADTDTSCPERFATMQPSQALELLNGKFLNEQAKSLSVAVTHAVGRDWRSRCQEALRRVLQRGPTDNEIQSGTDWLDATCRDHAIDVDRAFELYCLALLNLNEFIYLD